jgi:hypothetical protein
MTAVTDQSRWHPGYNSWNVNSAVPSLATVDEEFIDISPRDANRTNNLGWTGAGRGYSGLDRAGVNSGWSVGVSSGWDSERDCSGWSGGGVSSGCGGCKCEIPLVGLQRLR